MPTKVLLTDETQVLVEVVITQDVESGRVEPSKAETANYLIQLGYAALQSKRGKKGGAK